jgi:protein-L-isoaspartate(D-aspartate) O-methyltransferase
VVLGTAPVMQATIVRRVTPSECTRQVLFETVIEPLVGAPVPPAFRF